MTVTRILKERHVRRYLEVGRVRVLERKIENGKQVLTVEMPSRAWKRFKRERRDARNNKDDEDAD